MRPRERIALSLTPDERSALTALADHRKEPPTTTAARFVRLGLATDGAVLDSAPAPAKPGSHAEVPWLPPSSRAGAIEALRDRYPHDLRGAPADLATDRLAAERLAALSVWRDELDTGQRPDPREELAFAAELTAVSKWLEERGRRRAAGAGRG
jgi:hypothetical protein